MSDDPFGSTVEKVEKAIKAIREGEVVWPHQDVIRQAMEQQMGYKAPLDRHLNKMAEQRFLSAQLTDRIQYWCHHDARVDLFWHRLIIRVRGGLTDEIVDGIFQSLALVLTEHDKQLAAASERNLENIRGVGGAARKVIKAYDDAERRGEVLYMEAAVEELEAALYEVTLKEIDHDDTTG